MRSFVHRAMSRAHVLFQLGAFALTFGSPSIARAQNLLSVPFARGFIGVRGSSAGQADNVLTFATLGITRIYFIQNSSTTSFELQGNDLPGTLRIVRSNGATIDMPASVNWRQNAGSTSYLVGIIPRPTSPVSLPYSGGTYTITDGTNAGGTNIGAYFNGYAGPYAADASSQTGNAALANVLNALNAYLAEVTAARPAGPVTVTARTTADVTPTIGGTVTLAAGESFSVIVNGTEYSASTSPAVTVNGGNWSLTLPTLAVGTYDVAATISNADGYTLSDGTSNELTVSAGSVTIGGSFTASNKVYDGGTSATGTTSGLTLSGVSGSDNVTIASVTLAFQTAAVGTGKTVVISAVTLGGTDAGSYTVNLAGAPTATANITAKPLTLAGSFTAANKVYDGSTSATISTNSLTLVGVVGSDNVTISASTAAFATATVGTGKTVSLASVTLGGTAAANYSVSLTGAPTTTANISTSGGTVTIGGTFTANNKVYDGGTSATGSTGGLTLSGVSGSDNVTIASVTLAFQSAAVGTGKTVVISAVTLGGTDAGSYTVNLAGAPTATANITAKPLTLAGSFTAANKVYDGSTSATISTNSLTLVGVVGSDNVTISASTAAFATAAVGTGKTVSLASVTLGGTAAANYSISLTGAPTTTANITAKSLTAAGSFTASNKVYDGTTTATIASNSLVLTGIVGSEDVTIGASTAAFGDATVGTGKTVSLASLTLGGTAAGNYSVSLIGAPTTTANITAKPLTLAGSFTAANKVYDGSTSATISTNSLTLVGVVGSDNVTISASTAAFATAAVGTGKTVSLASVTLGGTAAANYSVSLTGAPTTTANISTSGGAVTIGGSFSANNKVYDGGTSATGTTSGLTLSGVSGSDNVTIASVTLAFQTAAVGTGKTVVISAVTLGGTDAGSYTVSLTGAPTATANITAKPLTLAGSFTAANKVYDGSTSATISTNSLTLVGVVGSDNVTISASTAAFATAAVGTGKTVSLASVTLGGTAAANYSVSLTGAPTTTANISTSGGAVTIGGSFSANNKVYDGGTSATGTTSGLTLSGVSGSDNVSIASVTLAFQTAAVGTGKTVVISAVTLGGTDAGSYTVNLAGAPTATANITAKPLTLAGSFTAANKVYDGSTSATISTNSLTLVGVVGSDNVTISASTAAFATAAVGTGKTVSLASVTLGGTAAANYSVSLTGAPTTTANISTSGGTVTIGGSFSANNKVYDGGTSATGTTSGLTLSGVSGSDNVTIASVTLAFQTAAVGTGKTVVISAVTLGGTDAGSYTVNLAGAPTATANITAKPLTLAGSFTAANKVYDGSTAATISTNSLTLVGVVGSDNVTVGATTAAFANATVGTGKPVTLASVVLGGTAAGNYSLSLTGAPTTTANIMTAGGTVTIGGSFLAADKMYDGLTSATGTIANLTLTGATGGDVLTIAAATFAFQNPRVGAGKTVILTSVTLGGANAGSYAVNLTGAPTTTASVTPRPLSLAGSFTAANKVYDATTSATITSNSLTLSGVVGSDNVLVSNPVAAFTSASVGQSKTVQLLGLALLGNDAGNYLLSSGSGPVATAAITPRPLMIGGGFTAAGKQYDASTNATITSNSLALNGLIPGDDVNMSTLVFAFSDAAAGANKPVRLLYLGLSGGAAGNYAVSLAAVPAASATIEPRPLTVIGSFTAADKIFDGTTGATIRTRDLVLVGVLGTDEVQLMVGGAAFADAAVGNRKTVRLTNASITGSGIGNYRLTTPTLTTTASILPATPPSAPLTLQATPGDGAITLRWNVPATEGCGPVTGYVVESSADNGATWQRTSISGASNTFLSLSGLGLNIGYLVRVAAVNMCGAGDWAAPAAPVVPIAPVTGTSGVPTDILRGTGTTRGAGGSTTTVTVDADTVIKVTSGSVALSLRAADFDGGSIAIDPDGVPTLERGGKAESDGRGFAAGSWATLYLFSPNGKAILLGKVAVRADGTFTLSGVIPDTLEPGLYTLQVNGRDQQSQLRSLSLAVEVTDPAPELVLTSEPSVKEPVVGDTIVITLTVTNTGRGAATSVVIPRAFDERGFQLVRASPIHGSYNTEKREWMIPRIEAGASARLLLTVIVLHTDGASVSR